MKNFFKILSTTSLLVGATFLVNQSQAASYDDLPSVEIHLENLDKLKEEISFDTETPIVFTKTDKPSKKEKKKSSKNKGNKKEKKQSSKEKVAHEFIEEDITPEPTKNTAIDSMKSMPDAQSKPIDLIPVKKIKGKKVKTEETMKKLPESPSNAKPNIPATPPTIITEPTPAPVLPLPTPTHVAPQPAPTIMPEPQKPIIQQPTPLPNNAPAPVAPQPPIPNNIPAPVVPTPAPTNVVPLPTAPAPSNIPPVNTQPIEAPQQKTSIFNKIPFIGKKENKVATSETPSTTQQPVVPPMAATPPIPAAINNNPIPTNNGQNLAPLPPKNIHTNKPMGENEFISPSNLDKLPSQLPTPPAALPPIPDEKGNIPPQTKLDAPVKPSFSTTTPLDPSKAPSGDTLILSIKYPNNGVALSATEQGNLLSTTKAALTGSKDTKIKIISYSDTQREDNSSRRVALQRVITARKFLIDHGLDSSRMNVQVIGSSTVTAKNKLDVIVAK
jgi:homeobox protein ESX1